MDCENCDACTREGTELCMETGQPIDKIYSCPLENDEDET